MAKYIDLEAALREIERRERLMVGDKTISVDALKRFILNRPAADVAPVVNARWVPTKAPFMNECKDCSVCGYRTVWGHRYNYCPNCGAKMDGGDNDEAD